MSSSLSLFLAGDSILTRPWSGDSSPEFVKLVREMRKADVTILNLETVIHEFNGSPQADSGGAWLTSPPQIASELAWAGANMVAHANNHAFDYGSTGVMETLEHVDKAGLVLAGSGEDLQSARMPRYFDHQNGRVGLLATASSFVSYGRASRSVREMRGRPGLNPLALESTARVEITRPSADRLQRVLRLFGYRAERFSQDRFRIGKVDLRVGLSHALTTGDRIQEGDLRGNLAAVDQAVDFSDVVVVSVHAHRQGRWLQAFARTAIDLGAHVFFVHGPHETRGIELYKGRPIFYCLGDFAFEIDAIERVPPDHYELRGLPGNATRQEIVWPRLVSRREAWEGVAALLGFEGGRLRQLRLLPVDLGADDPASGKGRPRYAAPELGQSIIARVAQQSRSYGTHVEYSPADNLGVVSLD